MSDGHELRAYATWRGRHRLIACVVVSDDRDVYFSSRAPASYPADLKLSHHASGRTHMKAMLHRDAPPVPMGDPGPEHTPVWKIEGEGELGNVGEVLSADDDWTYRPKTSPRRRNLEIILPTEWGDSPSPTLMGVSFGTWLFAPGRDDLLTARIAALKAGRVLHLLDHEVLTTTTPWVLGALFSADAEPKRLRG